MLEKLKKNYVNIGIVLVYTTIANLVYGVWSYHAWNLWYVTFIIVILITILGGIIGYFWLKSEFKNMQDSLNEEEKKE